MGYISDALNRGGARRPGPAPQEQPPPPDPQQDLDTLVEDAQDQQAGLSDLEPAQDQSAEFIDPPTPLAESQPEAVAPQDSDESISAQQPDEAAEQAPDNQPTPQAGGRRIPRHQVDERLEMLWSPTGGPAEQYRAVRTSILAKWEHRRHLVHTITSAMPQEGKTITSINLALAFAELRNRRTVVIEGDFRLPQFANMLRTTHRPGMIALLQGRAKLSEVLVQIEGSAAYLIPAGGHACNDAVQLLHGARMSRLLSRLREEYDHIIIDTPPVVELADAGIVGALSDDVLMVTRMNRTPRTLAEQAVRTLVSYSAPPTGLIATDHQPHRRGYYYKYGYHYYYRPGKGKESVHA